MAITVSIVEDNDQLRGTLARVINRAEGFRCLSQYPDAESAVEALPHDRPDVVLMDINLPGMNGVECVRRLKQLAPDSQVIMLTVYEDTENIFNALAAGASGYLLKRTPRGEVLDAILGPRGYGYKPVGNSLVIKKIDGDGPHPLFQTATVRVSSADRLHQVASAYHSPIRHRSISTRSLRR